MTEDERYRRWDTRDLERAPETGRNGDVALNAGLVNSVVKRIS
jgi:hypothetical protein